jgi:hypothetical protein
MGFYRAIYKILGIEYIGTYEQQQIEKQSRLKFVLNQQIIKTKDIKKITIKNKKVKPIKLKLSDFLKS